MRARIVAFFGLIALFTVPAAPALAWGELGHRVSATIALHRLTPTARARIERLLLRGQDEFAEPDFIGASVWADALRFDEPQTAGWHFSAYPLTWRGTFDSCPRASSRVKEMRVAQVGLQQCMVPQLYAFAARLETRPDDPRALKFLIHLAADVHQPLHVADNDNFGGNCVQVASPKGVANSNLHAFWDVAVLQPLGRDPDTIARALEARITPAEASAWTAELRGPLAASPTGWAAAWARESFALAPLAYAPTSQKPGCGGVVRITPAYARQSAQVAGGQLAKSGVRLAFLLNRLFDPGAPR